MLKEFFEKEQIFIWEEISVKELLVTDEKKWERLKRSMGEIQSAVLFLMPYFSGQITTNLSVYAQPEDYHVFARELSQRLEKEWKEKEMPGSFSLFADTSPVDERDAALKAGLGVRGENGLLIHPDYGSFVFIGILFLSKSQNPSEGKEIFSCLGCGACEKACPTGALRGEGNCLSELTQKKSLTPEEETLVFGADCKWGCDLCQNACPMNRGVKETPIPFFRKNLIPNLTEEVLSLEKEAFSRRAFSWRGKEILKRNLML